MQLIAAVVDQFGDPMSSQPAFTWSVTSGSGSVNASGLYTATSSAGSATVHATSAIGSADAEIAVVAPLAWYKADAAAGTSLVDASGNGETGTLNGSAGWASGVSGNALSLSGGSATLPAGIVGGLDDFTIATWFRIETLGTWSRIFDFGTGTTANMFLTPRAGGTGGPLRFAITTSGGAGEQQLNGPTLDAGTWYHVAITLAGNTATMYVNGIPVATNTGMTVHPAALGNTTQNYLGDSQYAPDPNFLGKIDDFRIYSAALPAEQILQLAAPVVIAPAAAAENPVTSTSTSLSVLAADLTAGEPALTYTWSTIGTPPAPVTFSSNGTNAAKNTVATFTQPGSYEFQVTIVNPAAGLSTTSTTSVTVSPALPGDYNLNGVVDAADYTVWRDTLGSNVAPFSGADGDGGGIVDQADYDVWRDHFGQTLATPVPAMSSDYNLNDVVDAADYSLWSDTLGANVPDGTDTDAGGNGAIDAADYRIWRANFGNTLPSGATGSVIAEVTTVSAGPRTSQPEVGSIVPVATPAAFDLALVDWAMTPSAFKAAGVDVAPSWRAATGTSATSDDLLLLAARQHRRTAGLDQVVRDRQENALDAETSRDKFCLTDDLFAKLGMKRVDRNLGQHGREVVRVQLVS